MEIILELRIYHLSANFGKTLAQLCLNLISLMRVFPDEADTRPAILSGMHYTYFGSLNLLITVVAIVVVSLVTQKQDEDEVSRHVSIKS